MPVGEVRTFKIPAAIAIPPYETSHVNIAGRIFFKTCNRSIHKTTRYEAISPGRFRIEGKHSRKNA